MPVGELSADAVPMLSAADSPLLILEARPQPYPPRRTPNPLAGFPLRRKASFPTGDDSAPAARRRGASVPPSSSSSSSPSSLASSSVSDPPTARGRPQQAPSSSSSSIGPPPGSTTSSRRRGFTLSRKFRSSRKEAEADTGPPRRRVTFRTTLHPDVAPCPALLSYDELLFNVAGLYQTTDFLHEPEDDRRESEDDGQGKRSTEGSAPPLERSVPLMIAEFLYRSAVYLGYPTGDKPWIPGFRETKRFSSNDVRRWRRLAHFDWAKEEREFEARRQQQMLKTKTKQRAAHDRRRKRRDSASSSDDGLDGIDGGGYRVDGPPLPSTDIALPSETDKPPRGRARLRAAVSKMMHRRRRHHAGDELGGGDGEADKKVDMERPPPVDPRLAASGELALLVSIVNSCVYCGAFRFRARDVVTLCNVDIDGF